MNELNNIARFLFSGIIGYHILFTLISGWYLDIRDAFFQVRLITEFVAFMIFLYGCDKFSIIFISISVITIVVIGTQFYNDPHDTYPGSFYNIFRNHNTLGFNRR